MADPPVERTEYGHVQRSSWRHIDRLDEEVVELDSPYSVHVKSGTQLFTFVLLGDQNAGKSTFLHAFTCHRDPNFTLLSSFLPVISASFVNTRLLWKGDERAPMDEIPFIDTDIARGTAVLTAEDFAFFVQEYDLDASLVLESPQDTVYYGIQMIELGGDHLDQMMHPELISSPAVADVVRRSLQMLSSVHKAVYFINGSSLCPKQPQGGYSLNVASLELLLERVAYLSTSMPADIQLMAVITRCPAIDEITSRQLLRQALTAFQLGDIDAEEALAKCVSEQGLPRVAEAWCRALPSELIERYQDRAMRLSSHNTTAVSTSAASTTATSTKHVQQRPARILFAFPIFGADHLQADGSLHPKAIVATMARMFKTKSLHTTSDTWHLVAQHVLRCYRQPTLRLMPDDSYTPWLSRDIFQDYLEDAHVSEVPDAHMLQAFNEVCQRLASCWLCLLHYGRNHSAVPIMVQVQDVSTRATVASFQYLPEPDEDCTLPQSLGTAGPSVHVRGVQQPGPDEQDTVHVRFPLDDGLLDTLQTYMDRNVPGELWLETDMPVFEKDRDAELLSQLKCRTETLSKRVCEGLAEFASSEGLSPDERLAKVDTMLWHLEDLTLAHMLLRGSEEGGSARPGRQASDTSSVKSGGTGAVATQFECSGHHLRWGHVRTMLGWPEMTTRFASVSVSAEAAAVADSACVMLVVKASS